MPVTLCEWTLFIIYYGCRSRWNHDFDIIAVRRDRCVGRSTVIRAILDGMNSIIPATDGLEQQPARP
jgi:hypothetical protein